MNRDEANISVKSPLKKKAARVLWADSYYKKGGGFIFCKNAI